MHPQKISSQFLVFLFTLSVQCFSGLAQAKIFNAPDGFIKGATQSEDTQVFISQRANSNRILIINRVDFAGSGLDIEPGVLFSDLFKSKFSRLRELQLEEDLSLSGIKTFAKIEKNKFAQIGHLKTELLIRNDPGLILERFKIEEGFIYHVTLAIRSQTVPNEEKSEKVLDSLKFWGEAKERRAKRENSVWQILSSTPVFARSEVGRGSAQSKQREYFRDSPICKIVQKNLKLKDSQMAYASPARTISWLDLTKQCGEATKKLLESIYTSIRAGAISFAGDVAKERAQCRSFLSAKIFRALPRICIEYGVGAVVAKSSFGVVQGGLKYLSSFENPVLSLIGYLEDNVHGFDCVNTDEKVKLMCKGLQALGTTLVGGVAAKGLAKLKVMAGAISDKLGVGAQAAKNLSGLELKNHIDSIIRKLPGDPDENFTLINSDFDAFLKKHGKDLEVSSEDFKGLHLKLIEERRLEGIANAKLDLDRLGNKVAKEKVECSSLNKVFSDAFSTSADCFEVTLKEDIKGGYCTCKSKGGRVGPFFTPCAENFSQYVNTGIYGDRVALPSQNRLDRCWRVDLPKDMKCYHGAVAPLFRGYGGDAQLLCQGDWMDYQESPGAPTKREVASDAGFTRLPPHNPNLSWRLSGVSPMSDFQAGQRATFLGKECLAKKTGCSQTEVAKIKANFMRGMEIETRNRLGNLTPDQRTRMLERRRTEAEEFQQYFEYLNGDRQLLPDGTYSSLRN